MVTFFLNDCRLIRFLDAYTDRQIRSLTLVLDPIPVNPYDPILAIQTATTRVEALQRLSSHIKKMALLSLSVTIDSPVPYTASVELSSIVNNLPDSCICLDIDTRCSGFILDSRTDLYSHQPASLVCDAIRTILPRLQHLRLRLPQLCSALFGTESHDQHSSFKAVRAANLKTCLINLALREPGSHDRGAWAALCGSSLIPHIGVESHIPPALPILLPRLKDFSHLNSVFLKRLRVIDMQPQDVRTPNSWAAWVRRDILVDTSIPIPCANIGLFDDDSWLARIPTDLGRAEDFISSLRHIEELAEGRFWSQTTRQIRLATPILGEYDFIPRPLTKELFLKRNRRTCMIWQNEEATGERLLPEDPGPLMEVWDLKERTPKGWTRENCERSPMARERDILMESLEMQ